MGPCTDGDVLPSREIGTSWADDGESLFPVGAAPCPGTAHPAPHTCSEVGKMVPNIIHPTTKAVAPLSHQLQ